MAKKKRNKAVEPPPPRPTSMHWTRNEFAILVSAVLSYTLVYWWTMWPSIGGGDSGELIASAYTLGIVHPPGYPLFTMMAHLFTYLPYGTVGWRVNLFSLVCGVTAMILLFLALRILARSFIIAMFVTSTLAFSTLIWRYSVQAEVFMLNAVFVCALLYLLVLYEETRNLKYVYFMGFTFGLGLSNHHTLLFVGLPMGIWILWEERFRIFHPKRFLLLFVVSCLGLLPYAYLFWASARNPLIAWGDITTWNGFFTHFFRKEYGTFKLATEGSDKFQLLWGLWYFLVSLTQHTVYIGLLFIAAGVWVIRKKDLWPPRFLYLLIFLPIFYLIVFHSLANLPFVEGAALYRDIVSRFWIMAILLFAPWMALGFKHLQQHFPLSNRGWQLGVILSLPLVNLLVNFQTENHHNNFAIAEFGRNMLRSLPQNALFFSLGDINTNSVRYVQTCEGFRQDVKVIDRSLMSYPWMKRIVQEHYPDVILPGVAYHPTQRRGFDFKRLFDANFDRHQIYVSSLKTKDSNEAFDKKWEESYRMEPYGLTFRIRRQTEPFDIGSYINVTEPFLVDPLKAFPKPPLVDSWDAVILAQYWLAHHMRAAEILKYALKTQSKAHFEMAMTLLEELVKRNPSPPADYYKNLGISHQHLMKFSEGDARAQHERRMLDVWSIFVQKTDRRDKTYEDIRTNLRAYGRL